MTLRAGKGRRGGDLREVQTGPPTWATGRRRALAWVLVGAIALTGCRLPAAPVVEPTPPALQPGAPAEPALATAEPVAATAEPAAATAEPAAATAGPVATTAEPAPATARPVATYPPLRELAGRHGLLIGAAVAPEPLRRETRYAEVLAREFNLVTTENALKFGPVHPARDRYAFDDADAIVAFATAHGMQVRGHTLVWHEQVPPWIEQAAADGTFDQAAWEEVLREHILTVVGRYRGRIQIWDVVNEAIGQGGPHGLRRTLWLDGVGEDYIDKAFRWAHEADPDALLFYNDYGAEDMGPKSRNVYELVAGMVERGVPIHGVGLQMHLRLGGAPDSDAVRQNIERLGELGLEVHITELDVRLPAGAQATLLARQAALYGDLLEVCLQAKACTAFIMWGFTDAHSWVPHFFPGEGDALIFDTSYAPKPAYETLRDRLMLFPPTSRRFCVPDDQGGRCPGECAGANPVPNG
jgi:endo-1,4-beta-xylanase